MTNLGKIIAWVIAIAVIVGAIIWGIWHKQSTPAVPTPNETGPIKVGFIGPLSGDAAIYGEPYRRLVALAADDINSKGGINGRQIEMVYEDGKCEGATAASAAQKLINVDKVKVIIGGFCSSESLSALPIAEKAKIVMLSPGSSSPDLTGKSPFFFRNYPSDATQGKALAGYSANTAKWKTVAIIQEQTDYSLGNTKAFKENFEKTGGKVVVEEFPTNTTDFRSILTKLKAEKPDALFINPQTPAAAGRIFKNLTDLKWSPKLLVNDVIVDPKVIADNKKTIEGAVGAIFGADENNEKLKQGLAAYKAKYNEDTPYLGYAQTEYDALYLIADGIKAVGTDGDKLAAWSRTITNWAGASGSITINSDGDRAGGHSAVMVKDSQITPVK